MVMRSDFCILRTTNLELRVGKAYIGPSFKVGRGNTDGQHICCPRNYYGPSPCSPYVLFVQHTNIRSYIQLLGIPHCIALPQVIIYKVLVFQSWPGKTQMANTFAVHATTHRVYYIHGRGG
jgi:hypothetical protein